MNCAGQTSMNWLSNGLVSLDPVLFTPYPYINDICVRSRIKVIFVIYPYTNDIYCFDWDIYLLIIIIITAGSHQPPCLCMQLEECKFCKQEVDSVSCRSHHFMIFIHTYLCMMEPVFDLLRQLQHPLTRPSWKCIVLTFASNQNGALVLHRA